MAALTVIRWETPTRTGRSRRPVVVPEELLAQLRSRPGQWALLVDADPVTAWRDAKAVRQAAGRTGESWRYEVRQELGETRGRLFARYVAGAR